MDDLKDIQDMKRCIGGEVLAMQNADCVQSCFYPWYCIWSPESPRFTAVYKPRNSTGALAGMVVPLNRTIRALCSLRMRR